MTIDSYRALGREEGERDARAAFTKMMFDAGFDAWTYAAERLASIGPRMKTLYDQGASLEECESFGNASSDCFTAEFNRLCESARSTVRSVQ